MVTASLQVEQGCINHIAMVHEIYYQYVIKVNKEI